LFSNLFVEELLVVAEGILLVADPVPVFRIGPWSNVRPAGPWTDIQEMSIQGGFEAIQLDHKDHNSMHEMKYFNNIESLEKPWL
jgi:hypothetical protein